MIPARSALIFGVCGLAVAAAAACEDDAVTPSPDVRYAAIQFVNAVSDTGEMDFRVVDIVSNAGLFDAVFRDVDSFPQPVEAGQRRIRAFMSSLTDQSVASDVVWDTVHTFLEGERYTFTLEGFARTGQTPALRAVIEQKVAPPAATANDVAIRVRHLAPTLDPDATGPVDVWFAPRGPAPLSGSPAIANVSFGDLTDYVNVPTGTYRVAVTATGTTAPILFQSNVPPGAAASGTGSAIAGTSTAGSALTILLVGRSVPGSGAPAGASATALDSLTRVADTAVAWSASPHGLAANDIVRMTGATANEYNGSFAVAAIGSSGGKPFFKYLTTGTPASPATGTPAFRAGVRDFTHANILVLVDRRP